MKPRAKSLFLSLSIALNAVLGFAALFLGFTDKGVSELAWAGAAMTTLGYAGFFGPLYLFHVPRTRRVPIALVVTSLWGLLLAFFAVGDPAAQWASRGMAVVGVASAIIYLVWYSRLDRGGSKIVVGEKLPAFPDSEKYAGVPTIYLFYRGNWCPICVAQVRELAERYREIEARGAKVVCISGQSESHTQSLARRVEAPMDFIVDDGLVRARALGLVHEKGVPFVLDAKPLGFGDDTVFPTLIVVDKDGVVRFADQTDNYRTRPEPDTFLALLDQMTPATT